MKRVPDYHDYSTIGEYREAVKAAGLDLSLSVCWLIQAIVERRGCGFGEAMDLLTASGALILLPQREAGGDAPDGPMPPIQKRLDELNEQNDETSGRKEEKTTD